MSWEPFEKCCWKRVLAVAQQELDRPDPAADAVGFKCRCGRYIEIGNVDPSLHRQREYCICEHRLSQHNGMGMCNNCDCRRAELIDLGSSRARSVATSPKAFSYDRVSPSSESNLPPDWVPPELIRAWDGCTPAQRVILEKEYKASKELKLCPAGHRAETSLITGDVHCFAGGNKALPRKSDMCEHHANMCDNQECHE